MHRQEAEANQYAVVFFCGDAGEKYLPNKLVFLRMVNWTIKAFTLCAVFGLKKRSCNFPWDPHITAVNLPTFTMKKKINCNQI